MTKTNINQFSWLEGGGEMGALIRAHDWSKTKIGPLETWPQSLRTALSICLATKFPMFVWWGRDMIVFYNDAYIPLAGLLKHPKFLGLPAQQQWSEIWEDLHPLTEYVFNTGLATWAENLPLFVMRKGFLEEAYFTFSYSPIRDESGNVGGIINPCQETTASILAERRLKTLRELGVIESKSTVELGKSITQIFQNNNLDLPFYLFYSVNEDEKSTTLISMSGVSKSIAPSVLDLQESSQPIWQVAPVFKSQRAVYIQGLRTQFGENLPKLPYEEMPDAAYVVPITLAGDNKRIGILILGISARLAFDENYEAFFTLVAKHITTQISTIRAWEHEKLRFEDLSQLDYAKTVFFSNVSHEFRTPLTLMLGPLENILQDKNNILALEVKDELQLVYRNVLRLLKLVNLLLDFSRVEQKRTQINLQATDLAQLTTELSDSFRSLIEHAGLEYRVQCEKISAPIYIDQELWEKICLNLISNAFKFTLQGCITVSLTQHDTHIELQIMDSGAGIPQQELPKIFERFYRVKGATGRSYEGSGIGLALVKEFVQLLEGNIEVISQEGKGTTFTVKIPRQLSSIDVNKISNNSLSTIKNPYVFEAEHWILPTTNNIESISTSSRREHILIADDSFDMSNYLKNLLQPFYEVEIANNGLMALERIKVAIPDLIVTDVMMPHLDGHGLLKKVRENPLTQAIPIIMLTADVGEEKKLQGLAAGADDYLIKPFSARELIARIQATLARCALRKELAQVEILTQHAAELTQAKDALEHSNQELSSFAYIASHDLREPVRGISIISELLMQKYDELLDHQGKEQFITLRQLVKHLVVLLDSLMNYARYGNLAMKIEPINLNTFIQEIIDVFKSSHLENHIVWTLHRLPNVLGDKGMIGEIFSNLISNAYKYNDQVEKKIEIGYDFVPECDSSGNHWPFSWEPTMKALYVKDNGIGIPPEQHDVVFRIFRRLHKPDEYHGGAGAGLTIVKKMIERHNGKIWIDSVPSEGTCFYIRLNVTEESVI